MDNNGIATTELQQLGQIILSGVKDAGGSRVRNESVAWIPSLSFVEKELKIS